MYTDPSGLRDSMEMEEEDGSQQSGSSDITLRLIKKIIRQQKKHTDKLDSMHQDLAVLMASGPEDSRGVESIASSRGGRARRNNRIDTLNRAVDQQILNKGLGRFQGPPLDAPSERPENQRRSCSAGTLGRDRPFYPGPCHPHSLTERAPVVQDHQTSVAVTFDKLMSDAASSSSKQRDAKKHARVQDEEVESEDMQDLVEQAKGLPAALAVVPESTMNHGTEMLLLRCPATGQLHRKQLLHSLTRMRESEIASTSVIGRQFVKCDERDALSRSTEQQEGDGQVDDTNLSSSWFVIMYKLFGLVPWDADKRWSSIVSLCFVLLLNVSFLAHVAYHLISHALARNLEMVPHTLELFTDVAIAFGATATLVSFRAPLWACLEESVLQCQLNIERNTQDEDSQKHWERNTGRDAFIAVVLWMLVVTGRSLAMTFMQTALDFWSGLHIVLFSISTGTLLSACHLLVYLARGMKTVAEHLVFLLCSSTAIDTADIKDDWKIILACMRSTSRCMQWGYASVSGTVVFIALSVGGDFWQTQGHGMAVLPNIVLCCCLPAVLLLVPLLTTSVCEGVSPLLCLMEPRGEDYLSLSLFFNASQAGFYVCGTRVTAGLIQKFIYITGIIAFTLSSKALHVD
eukprot:TRINITY_DN2185_c0_g1_i2.p1 TRINITY_DN2185_c0_g1~~TRINITY_DN2185_c0_g1_i2.p1  ORF type:complete len:630 (+),score=65.27 TRINITY_DN2185_c0_g1_i2:126-2015(+)